MAGSENDARGRAWAEARFKALGFDRVWTESVSFPVWDRGFESAAMTTPEATKLMVTALGGSIGTPEEGISGELMLFESAAALIEAEPGAAAGKIAFINQKMERTRDGRAYGQAVIARVQGASAAAKAGAIAVLVRSIGTDTDSNSPHTGTMRYDNTPTRIPAAAVSHQDADRIEALLRDGQTVAISLQLGARVRQGEYQSANVIGQFDGREKPEEIVLLGAHLDSWDLGTGAIDDGAGVAITMTAAELIGQSANRPRRSIRVVAYANEEQGVFGGKAYGEAHPEAINTHVLAAESDLLSASARISPAEYAACFPDPVSEERLRQLFGVVWHGALEEEEVLLLLLGEGIRGEPTVMPVGQDLLDLLGQAARDWVREFVPEAPDPANTGQILMGQLLSGLMRYIFDPDRSNSAEVESSCAEVLVRSVFPGDQTRGR